MESKGKVRWISCQIPRLMLLDLKDRGKEGILGRELRMFACACCNKIIEYIIDNRSLKSIEMAERYADGNASLAELKAACDAAKIAVRSLNQMIKKNNLSAPALVDSQDTEVWRLFDVDDWRPEGRRLNAAIAASHCADSKVITSNLDPDLKYCGDWHIARAAAHYAYLAGASRDELESMEKAFLSGNEDYLMYEDRWQADLIRCVFRAPQFRPINAVELAAESGIREIAESIYKHCDWDRMPFLGRELVTRGYANMDLASHCLYGCVHAKGCWALDVIRGGYGNREPNTFKQ